MARSPRSFANYPKRFKSRLEAVAKAKAEQEGRPCPVSHILTICLTKHLPILESEMSVREKRSVWGTASYTDGTTEPIYAANSAGANRS